MKTRHFFVILLTTFSLSNSYGQTYSFNPDDILVGNRKRPTVLLVGTFHFHYPNLDVVKTAEDKQVNILSAQKQREVQQLVDYIAKFKPTKIVVEERVGNNKMLKKYRAYKSGKQPLGRDEIQQVGFRLLDKFKLDTLYGADAGSIFDDLYDSKDSTVLRPTLTNIFTGWGKDYNYKCDTPMCKLIDSLQNNVAKMELTWPLLDYFKYLNSDKGLGLNYASYFSGEYFTRGQYRGADALAMDWYNRNLRIFRNIQNITTSPDDRILVLFGQGHVSILKQLFEYDPAYQLIKFNDLGKSEMPRKNTKK